MDEEKRLISDFSHSELQTIGTTDNSEDTASKLVVSIFSTSPTGSENHLSPLRFQTFNRKVFCCLLYTSDAADE